MIRALFFLLAVCASGCSGAQAATADTVRFYPQYGAGVHVRWTQASAGTDIDSIYILIDTTASFPLGWDGPRPRVRYVEPKPGPFWLVPSFWFTVAGLLALLTALVVMALRQVEDTDDYDPDDEEQVIG